MALVKYPLEEAIVKFCDENESDTTHTECLNSIIILLNRTKDIHGLVSGMPAQLTSTDEGVRSRGALLLAEVLGRLPTLPLNQASTAYLVKFLCERMADFPR
jgi:hypothetical protein